MNTEQKVTRNEVINDVIYFITPAELVYIPVRQHGLHLKAVLTKDKIRQLLEEFSEATLSSEDFTYPKPLKNVNPSFIYIPIYNKKADDFELVKFNLSYDENFE